MLDFLEILGYNGNGKGKEVSILDLLKFMNSEPNWKVKLATKPYALEIKNNGPYWMLKYNMLESDFNLDEVKQARGCIVKFDPEKNKWFYVCRPFVKFFNYGEKYADTNVIDWSTAVVQEKIDGSLIKVWYDDGKWHISTNGTIDAFSCSCGVTDFGSLFLSGPADFDSLWELLDPEYTYLFELTSPYNHIVVKYEEVGISFLARIHNRFATEDWEFPQIEGIRKPKVFPHRSLAECIAAAHAMGDDEEGYVVVDAAKHRIKIKGDEYLKLHKLRGNGPLTVCRVIEMWQNESLDDFVAYYPEFHYFIDRIVEILKYMIQTADFAFNFILEKPSVETRADFARYANTYAPPVRAYLYAKLDNRVKNGYEYFVTMRPRLLANYIGKKIGNREVGIDEEV